MYINRVRTMKKKSKLLRCVRAKFGQILSVCILGILLGDSIWDRMMPTVQNQVSSAIPEPEPQSAEVLLIAGDDSGIDIGSRSLPSGVMHVNRYEFARQIAISILVEHDHEISDERVSFMRDVNADGTAISQFADSYGRAIERGIARFEVLAPARPQKQVETVSTH